MTIKLGTRREDLADAVRAECARRLAPTDWMVTRAAEPGGKAIPDAALRLRVAIRNRSTELIGMTPIPPDYTDDKWWPS